MKCRFTLFILSVLLTFVFGVAINSTDVQATVGGPIYISDFKYNPADESVYYIWQSYGGRGCPPELFKLSLNSEQVDKVYSCEQGEKFLSQNGEYDYSRIGLIGAEIDKITESFKRLSPLSLRTNNINVDVDFVQAESLGLEFPDEIIRRHFTATVYQDNKKVTEFSIVGCNIEQPFLFQGYAIPGFEKKIILLLSAKGDCWEGGYIYETLHVVGGVDNLDKINIGNFYKDMSALTPNEGNLVIFESEKVITVPNNDEIDETGDVKPPTLTLVLVSIISILLGAILAGLFLKKFKV